MLEDPQKILTSRISNFLEKKSEVASLGLGKYQKEQNHIFGEPSLWSVYTANGFMAEQVKKTPLGGIGLKVEVHFVI